MDIEENILTRTISPSFVFSGYAQPFQYREMGWFLGSLGSRRNQVRLTVVRRKFGIPLGGPPNVVDFRCRRIAVRTLPQGKYDPKGKLLRG